MFFIILVCISMITMATASDDYCEWGYCYLSEYCCGDNMCCPDNGTTWILICGLLSALVAISICCGCLFRYYDTYRLRMQWPFSRREPLLPQTKA